jgi:exosortase family protein XrtF
MLKEFRPTILFLIKFGLIFGLGSFLYGNYIKGYQQFEHPIPDPITEWVAQQTLAIVQGIGYDANLWYPESDPLVVIYIKGFEDDNVTFYEGCNGINIMILFVAFVFAFGSRYKNMLWFMPVGLLAIHLFNLLRLVSLAVMATLSHSVFHFFHKYAFTGVIYAFVLFLWYLWATRFGKPIKGEK